MAILKNDKALIQTFVRINFSSGTATSAMPDWELAEERFLLPLIGRELYEEVTELAGATTPVEGLPAELLKKCRAIVAPLAYLIELPTIQTQITDAGLRNISTGTMQSAHRWEYNEVKEYLIDKGSFAIDNLLRFLILNRAEFTAWKAPTENIFQTAEEFNRYFPLHHPYRTFFSLRPLIREVEDFYIASTIGEEFLTWLKRDGVGNADKIALEKIKKAVAQIVIVKAVEKLSVKLTDTGFTVQLSAGSNDAANSGNAPAKDNQLSLLHDSCQRSGDAYLLQLKEYLDANATAENWPIYFSSKYYTPAVTGCTISPNEGRGVFGL